VSPPEEEEALVGALTGAWTVWPPEVLVLPELELDVDGAELELLAVVEAVALPGMVAAPMAPKRPTPATPPAAAHMVSRRRPRSRRSRRAASLGCCHVCIAQGCSGRLKPL
jgi:hypothetical protein